METDRNAGDSNDRGHSFFDQIAEQQKIWAETMGKMMQSAVAFSPNNSFPDFLRQMRGGMFQGQAKSWEEILRSPQFLEGMRQWLDSAVAQRKVANDFMTRAHHEMQGTAHSDIDAILLAVRHMEQRILDRLEKIEEQVGMTSAPANRGETSKRKTSPSSRSRKGNRNPTAANTKNI
jgi:hypothetical protein